MSRNQTDADASQSILQVIPQAAWIFGYGSLMWRPGFEYLEKRRARLDGLHRFLCVYSWFHRGSQDEPGLVMGLDAGGSCDGIVYRIASENWDSVVEYLRAREQVTPAYLEAIRDVVLDGTEETVSAVTYIVDRTHAQYAGKLSLDAQLQIVRKSIGQSGENWDYVVKTAACLSDLNIDDPDLQALATKILEDRSKQAS